MTKWVISTGQVYCATGGSFPAQTHTTYDYNIWDGAAQGSNTNWAGLTFPEPNTGS